MKVTETKLKGCFIIEPVVFGDNRGWFMESFSKEKLEDAGIVFAGDLVQDNQSFSAKKGTLRGIHFQQDPYAQTRIVRCTRGSLFDVAVDLRKDSPTYMQWFGIVLSEENKKQLYVPRGFGHGFVTLEDNVEIQYKTDNYYNYEADGGIIYNDPQIGISWPVDVELTLSEKDMSLKKLSETKVDF